LDPIFRRASETDADEVAALFQAALRHLRAEGIDQWDELYPDRAILEEDIAKGEMYLLIDEGKLASAVVLNEEQYEEYSTAGWIDRDGRTAVVHRLCVHPDLQGQGVGRETMRRCEELLAEAGYSSARLDAFSENRAALRLYEGLGYCRRGTAVFRKGAFGLYEKLL
jgi:ribosomal protein S18 acetylase RimI-like enzyme